MRKEYFIRENVDIDGETRDIVLYGKLINYKFPMTKNVELINGNNRTFITEEYFVKRKLFVIGFSICHPDDIFDMNVGVEFAKNRALDNPINTVMFKYGDCISERVLDEILFATVNKVVKTIKKEVIF